MKRLFWILFLAGTVWLTAVACTAAVEEEMPTPEPVEIDGGALNEVESTDRDSILDERIDLEAEPDVFPRATLTPPPVSDPIEPESAPEEGYPAVPTPTPYPEGYELPPTVAALDPYPEASGSLVWIIKPVGEQCAESPATPDLQTAVADMVAFGIPVEASEMTDLAVCSACGCPTSAHFRLQIDAGFLGNAETLGWVADG